MNQTPTTNALVQAQGFVAQEDWPVVSVMMDGFGDPSLPASEQLVGQTIDIDYDNGWTVRHEFLSAETLTWTLLGEKPQSGSCHYRAVEARPGVQVIDFLKGEGRDTHSVTIVLNLSDGLVTTADSSIFDRGGEGRTETTFLSGRIAGMGRIEPRKHSDALVGKRIYYRYSATERYEHIYLNSGTFVWHCISGGERGLADVDETRTWELADDLVIFYWKEGVMPVESFLVVDLREQRSIGRMFCWENPSSSVVHIPFDSKFTILNETSYPND